MKQLIEKEGLAVSKRFELIDVRQIAGGESQKVTSRHTNQNGRTESITNYAVDMKRKEYITIKACTIRHRAR